MAKFYGWRVVGAAFVLAFFGWGLGFYGPPVYLHAVREARGFSLGVVSTAVTVHYLAGAIVAANVPALYRRFGLPAVTMAAAIAAWRPASSAGRSRATPWQLFAATLVSGAGWAAMGGVAVNAVVSPWFVRARPAALGTAYNGASFAGLIFSPLWVTAIALMGFPAGCGDHRRGITIVDRRGAGEPVTSRARRSRWGLRRMATRRARPAACGDLAAREAAARTRCSGATSASSRLRPARRSRCSRRSA